MITIVAQGKWLSGKREAFLAIAKELIAASRQEAGNHSYHLFEDLQTPDSFTFIENWHDQSAIDSHAASAHFQSACARFADCLNGDLDIRLYQNTGL